MVHVDENGFWDKARLLVSNTCNFRCAFCHNEGQPNGIAAATMSVLDAKIVVDALSETAATEICFSGGEPFLNDGIVEMIRYADFTTTCDISCASNLSLTSKGQLDQLKTTRVKINVQFPFVDPGLYRASTGGGDFEKTVSLIDYARGIGLEVGLNTVIQKDGVDKVAEMLAFALEREIPLKLLPQVGLRESEGYKELVLPIIERCATSKRDKGTGAIRYSVEANGHCATIMYIDSPCFTYDFESCRRYGEVRILPSMRASTCLLRPESGAVLEPLRGSDHVRSQLRSLWNSFNGCC